MRCSACAAPAVTHLAYAGRSLCREHFLAFFERRFKAELRAQVRAAGLEGGARIVVGVSGGKDSSVLVTLLSAALGSHPRFSITPVLVDEGIPGYRDRTIPVAKGATERIGLKLQVVSHAADHGVTTQEVAETLDGAKPCAVCGVFRRSSLNRAARTLGADLVATGHNLDDLAETHLMNIVRGDLERVLRTAPHEASPDGLVPRIVPLRMSPEREVALYAVLAGIPFHDAECPHSVDSTRGAYRKVLLGLLDRDPDVRHTLVRLGDELKVRVAPRAAPPPGPCAKCGEPATAGLCRACELAAAHEPRC